MHEIRQVRESDLADVAELDAEAFSPYGTAENLSTFGLRFRAFPLGFVVLTEDNEIAGYGCSEKWIEEREPGLDENPLETHDPQGMIFCITGMAVRMKHRGKGYGLRILDHMIEIAQSEMCERIVLETTHAQGLYAKREFTIARSRIERGITLDVMALGLRQSS